MEQKPSTAQLRIDYAAALISRLLPAPFLILNKDGAVIKSLGQQNNTWNVLVTDPPFLRSLFEAARKDRICLVTSERPVYYGCVEVRGGAAAVIGPVTITRTDNSFAKLYALRHHAENTVLMRADPAAVASVLLLIHAEVTGESLPLTDFLDRYFLKQDGSGAGSGVIEEHVGKGRPHNPDAFERQIRESIGEGSPDGLKRAFESPYASMRGTLARDPLRNAKNLGIVDVTIATRAAIDAGLGTEEMYIVSDAFIAEIEDCRFPEEAASLARACAYRCARMVARHLSDDGPGAGSLLAAKVREYIDRHIGECIRVEDIAAELRMSGAHLMRLYKSQAGMTLGEAVRIRRVYTAKMMLRNPDPPIASIASLLGFSSQSHFGRVFRQVAGMTPARYRQTHMGR
ncbi:MAG: helix-turn-helix domain-containing protein [Succinivibrio sp.]